MKGTRSKCLADLTVEAVEGWLSDLVAQGRSARTRNLYLAYVQALMNWAVKRRMIERNPLKVIDAHVTASDRRQVSRALTPDEFDRLISATPSVRRRLYYLLAGRCGLRWSEVKRLQWSDVDLEGGWLELRADATKAGRADAVPLAPDVLDALREASPDVAGGEAPVFSSSPTIRTFRRDLERAGIEYETDRGRVDRKSLRKTFGTHLAIAGVDLRLAVKLMRHSDPRLTMNVYTDPMLLDMQGAVARISGAKLGTNSAPKAANS